MTKHRLKKKIDETLVKTTRKIEYDEQIVNFFFSLLIVRIESKSSEICNAEFIHCRHMEAWTNKSPEIDNSLEIHCDRQTIEVPLWTHAPSSVKSQMFLSWHVIYEIFAYLPLILIATFMKWLTFKNWTNDFRVWVRALRNVIFER